MKYFLVSIVSILVTLLIYSFVQQSAQDLAAQQRQADFLLHNSTYLPPLPDKISLAGEIVPLSDFEVRERLEREIFVNTFWQSQTILLLKKTKRWFPEIEKILKQQGVPDDFKYLALAESGLSNVVSPSNAAGFWQFLPSTAKQYNLTVNAEVDERYHLEKATVAACKYLKEAYAKFGSWNLVAASYNMGIDGLQKQIDTQKQKNYFALLLNDETSRYVLRILALKEIACNPSKYGFKLENSDFYKPLKSRTLLVDSTITDIAQFAINQKINYKQLKMLNPWLRQNTLTNKAKEKFEIKILIPS
ncbi:MAG TPA: lytic transglycosylase domain-containing protein [Bacteroidia bacterium]|nr:lytic transglycosylase domain-containing protein [Bacteroidia bacterium]HNU33739.1 lytic transglycosylase domain-containing protein [Bacteroidia bacterium]